tara:strand:- start:180 stop:467 length:288 start_codon:yes stop_codon:yes gene_type:complete
MTETNNSVPQLNFDMISKILNMRMNIKKEELKVHKQTHEIFYKKCMNDLEECFNDIDYLEEGDTGYPRAMLDKIYEWSCDEYQEQALDDYLESQE